MQDDPRLFEEVILFTPPKCHPHPTLSITLAFDIKYYRGLRILLTIIYPNLLHIPQKLLSLISGVVMRLSLKVYFIREYPSFLLTWFLMVNLSSRLIYVTRFHFQDLKALSERKQWVKVKL